MPTTYTVRDKESGKVITFRWNGEQPPTDTDLNDVFNEARHQAPASEQPAAKTQPMLRSRTGALYQPPAESGLGDFARGAGEAVNPIGWMESLVSAVQDPMGAAGSVATAPVRFLGDLVNHPAHALGTMTGSLGAGELLGALPVKRLAKAGVAGAGAGAEKLPVVGAPTKAAIDAARGSWSATAPSRVPPPASAPRLAGKAPTLQESIASALDQVRQGEPPTKVSLPGGDTYRAEGAVPSAANARTRLWHGSPSELSELYPGSMLTDQQSWAAGYTTRQPGGVGPETFTGRVHGVDVPTSGRTLTVSTLHSAESKLLELATQALGRPPTTLREAATAVREQFGYDAIVAKRPDGSIAGAIPLQPSKVAQAIDPVAALRDAISRGESIPDNLKEALARQSNASTARSVPNAPPRPAAAAPAAPPATAPGTPAAAPAASAPPGPKAAAIAAKLNLTAQEYTAFQDLLQQGYPVDRVLQAIQGQRAAASLSQRFQLPSDAEVGAAVADRNASGRWPQDRR